MLVRYVLLCALIASVLFAASRFGPVAPSERDVMPTPERYPYVYVLADGTARELHAAERTYLETEFTGGDGAMPYIKDSYEARDGWGEITGYLKRSQLPDGTTIADAPAADPRRSFNREQYIAWLRSKGVEVTENSDGSFSTSAPRR